MKAPKIFKVTLPKGAPQGYPLYVLAESAHHARIIFYSKSMFRGDIRVSFYSNALPSANLKPRLLEYPTQSLS